jgi:hypothetical protein
MSAPPFLRKIGEVDWSLQLKQIHAENDLAKLPSHLPSQLSTTSAPVRLHPDIREHLRLWQEKYGEMHLDDAPVFPDASSASTGTQQMTRGAEPARNNPMEEDQETEDLGTEIEDIVRRKLLLPGDLVEVK